MDESINQSINQSVHQSVSQSVSPSVSLPVSQSVGSQSVKLFVSQPINRCLFIEEDLSNVFAKREVKPVKSKTVTVSQLSRQLEESRGKPNNPFLEYSKYDGEVRTNQLTQWFSVEWFYLP